jgi:hypothetical protein
MEAIKMVIKEFERPSPSMNIHVQVGFLNSAAVKGKYAFWRWGGL